MALERHSHGHAGGAALRLPQGVRRMLAVALAPFVVATIVGLVILWPNDSGARPSLDIGQPIVLENATVDGLAPVECGGTQECFTAAIELTSGPDRGTSARIEVLAEGPGTPKLEVGDRIVVAEYIDPTNGESTYSFSDFQRTTPLRWLAVLFVVTVVGIARWKGLAALAGLVLTGVVLIWFIVPAVLEGKSPVAVSLVGGAAIMIVVLYLTHGVNAPTTVALLGTLGTIAFTAGLAAVFVAAAHLTGGTSEEAVYVQLLNDRVNLSGLLLGGIVIGALGVLNDVTVTQTSAVWEIHAANPSQDAIAIWRSGMRVGRDHIASVVDTLVLAYAGASLPLLIIFSTNNLSISSVLTGSIVAEELVRSLVGSIGLVASVPVTTALAAFVVTRPSDRK